MTKNIASIETGCGTIVSPQSRNTLAADPRLWSAGPS